MESITGMMLLQQLDKELTEKAQAYIENAKDQEGNFDVMAAYKCGYADGFVDGYKQNKKQ